MKILLSIKPKYAEKIFSGEKTVELRRAIWSQDIKSVVVYASAPTSMIVGEFSIKNIWYDYLWTLWKFSVLYCGISYKDFKQYFKGKTKGFGIDIERPILYDKPKPLSDYGIARPPQNFMYLKDEHILNAITDSTQ